MSQMGDLCVDSSSLPRALGQAGLKEKRSVQIALLIAWDRKGWAERAEVSSAPCGSPGGEWNGCGRGERRWAPPLVAHLG